MDVDNKARDVLIEVVTEETQGSWLRVAVELAVDRLLAQLWIRGYKIVPLSTEDERNIDRDQA